MANNCSFCGERPPPGSGLVTGPGVAICGKCASISVDVLTEAAPRRDGFVITDCRVASPHPRRPMITHMPAASVVVKSGIVSWVGSTSEMPARYRDLESIDAGGRLLTPGFVDSGTWLLGSSHRSRPDPESLVESGRRALSQMLTGGVTMLDLRVGGSSDPVLETTLLAAARTVGDSALTQVVVTWVVGRDMAQNAAMPQMAMAAARLASMALLTCGSDDLERSVKEVAPLPPRLLAQAGETPIEADLASIEFVGRLGQAHDSVVVVRSDNLLKREMVGLRGGERRVGLATGFDPHGVELGRMPLLMMMAVELAGWSTDLTLWAATRGSSLALADDSRGLVRKGATADLLLHDGETVTEVIRKPLVDPWSVIVGGQILS